MSDLKIKRALIAVYDKTGITEFARALVDEFGIEILSTGGTAKHLKAAGIPVTMVEQVTGFPEMLDGRVKTLHPKIHAAILADRDNPDHMRQLAEHGIQPIDMVVVNLYPFEHTVADPNCTFDQAIEMIDIGGPCMLRAAAKNHKHVLVVSNGEYENTLMHLRAWQREADPEDVAITHHAAGQRAFHNTARYDIDVAKWLERTFDSPRLEFVELLRIHTSRYGENPHQIGKVYRQKNTPEATLVPAGKPIGPAGADHERLSYNNYVDGDSALGLVKELSREAKAGRLVWHRFPTGDLCHRFETGGEEQHVDQRLEQPRYSRRNLPHIQVPGRTYFVTFRAQEAPLSPVERDIVLEACTFWHAKKATFHAIVVMPDHVHILLTPHEKEPGQSVSLGEILHSIKRHSSREIHKSRGTQGALWLDETFDRVMRDESEFAEKWEYMEANPRTAGLSDAEGYKWFWRSNTGFREVVREESQSPDTSGTGESHRLKTGATNEGHRLKTGATEETGATTFAVAFIKHTNACGCAVGEDPIDTYRRAYLGDPIAAAGGVLCMNFPVTKEIAGAVMNSYGTWGKAAGAAFFKLDVWIAPSFDEDAVVLITTPTEKRKWGKECRLLAVGDMSTPPDPGELDYKKITGGMLVQTRDLLGLNEEQWKVVTKRAPSESEMADLRFAWLVCKHTKSNAITIVRDGMLLGSGAGQMSRVKSCDLAIQLARENGHGDRLAGAVAAGDAFFPVPDGPQKLIDAGITAIIHPGGSNRDAETVAAADAAGVAMIVTGTRHFKH